MRYHLLPILWFISVAGSVSGAAVTCGRPPIAYRTRGERIRRHQRQLATSESEYKSKNPIPTSSRTVDTLLVTSLRGGATTTDLPKLFQVPLILQDLIAKAACVFFIGQSSTAWLAPHRTCLKYGLTTSTINVACNRKLATAYLAATVIMYGMLFQKCTRETAIGAAAMAWMVEQLKARLFYEAEDIGKPIITEYLVAAIATLTAYATLLDRRFASLAMKISSGLVIGNGLAFFMAPASVCKLWGLPVGITAPPTDKAQYAQQLKEYSETVFLHRYTGVALVFSGIMAAVLAWEGGIMEAIGYSFGYLFLINCWSFLKTSDFKRLARVSFSVQSKIDFKKRMSKLFFPLFNAVVSSILLFGGTKPPSSAP